METPSRNVYWKDITLGNDEVESRRNIYVVHRGGVPFGVVYWMGNESLEAQEYLKRISFALCTHKGCNIRVKKYGELCTTHAGKE